MSIEKSAIFMQKNPRNVFAVQKIALPLYSLSATNWVRLLKQMILDNIPYRQAVQRVLEYIYLRILKIEVRNEKRTVKFIWYTYLIPASTDNSKEKISRRGQSLFVVRNNLQRRVWSWLRMNASYRLNTCKSRGLLRQTTGARVSNAYPTCPSYWDSLSKGRLIPNNMRSTPVYFMKAPAMKDGDAFH